MLRASLRCIGLSAVVILAACSSSGSGARRSPPTRPHAPSTTTTVATPVPSTTGTSTPTPAPPLVAESDGWRLVLTRPSVGATVGSSVRLCYELSGGTREPVAALIVTLRRSGSKPLGPMTVDASIGRGSARVDFPDVHPGAASLEVQLRADGRPLDGVRIEVQVEVVSDAPIDGCP